MPWQLQGQLWKRALSQAAAPHTSIAAADVEKLLDTTEGDVKTGVKIILKALEAPLYHIVANAGLEGAVIINKVKESEVGVGFDAYKEEYVKMVEAGILDPAKVTRTALLQNSHPAWPPHCSPQSPSWRTSRRTHRRCRRRSGNGRHDVRLGPSRRPAQRGEGTAENKEK